ncbi:isocitrate/isopropylmalate dehydrogenase family protein [Halocatena marina]|uniref:isocitrate/isopropylmalate dehydrogenase family protein n=1 Tax=Halocatena marina TaxID=2934937 RepID=UPI00201028C6|nr:isocitrate/isopropylmalate dehydrogenase family protein [Halocatena marina]
MEYDIALLPGDGIGNEVVEATIPVLDAASEKFGFEFQTTWYDWGSQRYLQKGEMLPDTAYDQLAEHDAILHGAMGHPDVPDHISSTEGHISIRREFDHYINLRPAILFDSSLTPLKGVETEDVNIVWYRENTEGEYIDVGGRLNRGGSTEIALQSSIYTKEGIRRIAKSAFRDAKTRSKKVTNVTKSNALSHGPVFWDEVVEEVSEEFPDVRLENMYVDAANMHLVQRPEDFDVVLSSNLFGDILTDLTAAIVGGLGMTPSANLNPNNDYPGMFEPVHGSAPDIAGDGIANPLATVLSSGLMFDDFGQSSAAAAIREGVEAQVSDETAPKTPDLGGSAKTRDVVDDLVTRF